MKSESMINYATYNDYKTVEKYSKVNSLQEPERKILELLKPALKNMRMLDIGVGAGRTTRYFSKHVKEYVGIDYSPLMIERCKHNFENRPDNIKFEIIDVIDLSVFPDNYFDFVLFSFNGIDYLSKEERQLAFKNILRVGKNGGYFSFSTHNILSVKNLFDFKKQFTSNPKQLMRNLKTWFRLKLLYPQPDKLYKNRDYVIFNDGSLNFNLLTFYTNPQIQKEELSKNFTCIKMFDSNGNIINGNELDTVNDNWIYFLCKFNK